MENLVEIKLYSEKPDFTQTGRQPNVQCVGCINKSAAQTTTGLVEKQRSCFSSTRCYANSGGCGNIGKRLPCSHWLCVSCLNKHVLAGSITLTCPLCLNQSIIIISDAASASCCSVHVSSLCDTMIDENTKDQGLLDDDVRCKSSDRCSHAEHTISQDTSRGDYSDMTNMSLGISNRDNNSKDTPALDFEANSLLKAKWLDLQKMKRNVDQDLEEVSEKSSEEKIKLDQSVLCIKHLMELRRQALLDHYETVLSRKLDVLRFRADAIAKAQREILDYKSNAISETESEPSSKMLDKRLFPNLNALLLPKNNGFSRKDDDSLSIPRFYGLDENSATNLVGKFGGIFTPGETTVRITENNDDLDRPIVCCVNKRSKIHFDIENDAFEKTTSDPTKIQVTARVRNYFQKTLSGTVKSLTAHSLELVLPTEGVYALDFAVNDMPVSNGPIKLKCVGEMEFSSSTRACSRQHYKSTTSIDTTTTRGTDDDLVAQLGCKGFGLGQFHNPQDVCCTTDGTIVVTDSNNQCVQLFDPSSLECVLKFGSKGRGSGQLIRPTGLACKPNDNDNDNDTLFIADYDNKWIGIYRPDGTYIGRFGGSSNLLGPKGVLIDRHGHLIVVDNRSSTVFVFDGLKFKLIRKFGIRGDKQDQLAGPHYAALGQNDQLLITDFHHHCVKVFDCSGKYISSFGSIGEGNGQFNAPTGIATDQRQHAFVADWGNNRIQIFDLRASFLGLVNSAGSPLYGPQGVFVDRNDQLFVSDSGNHCVKIYRCLM